MEPENDVLAFFRRLFYHRRHHHPRVVLFIDGYGHELNPHRRTCFMTSVTAGHKITYAIAYLDENGRPMITTPTLDGPPSWSNAPSAPGIDTLTPAADGSSAVLQTNAADADSTDTVSMSVVVGGKSFSASDSVTISAAPQVLSSVEIVGTVS